MTKESADVTSNKFLRRCVPWNWFDHSTIVTIGEEDRQEIHLDEWETSVFYLADGYNTLEQIIHSLISRRGDMTEDNFKDRMQATATKLTKNLRVVELTAFANGVIPRFEIPLKDQ